MQSTLGARARCAVTQRPAAFTKCSRHTWTQRRVKLIAKALPEALLFDCDGVSANRTPSSNCCDQWQFSWSTTFYTKAHVSANSSGANGLCVVTAAAATALMQVLVDTERDGHRVSFNEAFKQKGELSHVRTCLHQQQHQHQLQAGSCMYSMLAGRQYSQQQATGKCS